MSLWIDNTESLKQFVADPTALVGLDTEFMRTDTYWARLALVQVSLGERIGLIDPLADTDTSALGALLVSPAHLVVMHSPSEDLEVLATVTAEGIGRLFDTQSAAAFAGLGAGLGYQRLVLDLLGTDLPKAETRSDWMRRPLSPQQIEYAAQDVVHLPAIHAELADRLERRGYAAWHAEDCARMLERARLREPDPEPQTAFRGAADWPRERQALLRRVLRWREATARRIDRPRPWLLDDPRLLDLSQNPPLDADDLAQRTRGLRALRTAERAELLGLLQAPIGPDELDFAPILPSPGPRERRVLDALKQVVAQRASELDLPEGLLCARRHLEALLATRRWPNALQGWRHEILHDALMARLPDA